MSIGEEIMKAYKDDISTVRVNSNVPTEDGADAVEVEIILLDGTVINEVFTGDAGKNHKGMTKAGKEEIAGLMKDKVKQTKAKRRDK